MDHADNQLRPFYHEYAWAYDLLVDQDIEKRLVFINTMARIFNLPSNSRLLDAGCGTGQLSVALADNGFSVTGVDSSSDLLYEANSRIRERSNIQFVNCDILKFDFVNTFDLALLRGVLNDFILENDRAKAFENISKSIVYCGLLIADVRSWDETSMRKINSPITEKTIETSKGLLSFKSITKLSSKDKLLNISETHTLSGPLGNKISKHKFKMRCWTTDEIYEYCFANNLEVKLLFGSYALNSLVGETDRIIFVAQKVR